MNENRPCKKELLEWINIVSFAVDDVKLFLDTHPNCPEALEFFDEFKKQRVQALKEYAKYYGPLTLDTANTPMDCWKWINEPWPWQEGGNVTLFLILDILPYSCLGHGRKEDVNLCGIMKNGYNTLLKLLRQIRRLLRLSYHSSVDRIVRTYKVKWMWFLPIQNVLSYISLTAISCSNPA